ncbi:MAG: DUF4199 family protein [Bacteroidales bacterium]|nr:DUF4199 family protein [Bacteroidales bacterium]
MDERRIILNYGLVTGLVLGALCIAFSALTQYCVKSTWLAALLWFVKFAACIWVMREMMILLDRDYDEVSSSDTFRAGAVAAVSSAVIYAGFTLAEMLFISPDMISDAVDTILEQYRSMLDSNAADRLEGLTPRLPVIIFWLNLVYCSLYGILLSTILSRMIPSPNPFSDTKEEK